MKLRFWVPAILTFIFSAGIMAAQAPAGSTGQCRDGSYTTAAKKSGACSGHKGVQTWFAASGGAPAASATAPTQAASPNSQMTGPSPQPAPKPAAPAQSQAIAPQANSSSASATRTEAPGGGPGMVWVNTSTKVYHCPGKEFYGTTKNGKYMSEADAVAMGARADHNKPCTK